MKNYYKILKSCSLFEGVELEQLETLLQCLSAHIIMLCSGESIFQEGDPASNIGIVLSGEARIERTDYYGNRSIVARISPPQLFGEAFALSETKSLPIRVFASENSEIMLLDCRRITMTCTKKCDFHAKLIFNLLKTVAEKNIILNRRIEITSKRTTREKLMTYLLLVAKKQGPSFTIPFDRQELADYLEVDRSGLSSEIGKLCREGIIECHRSDFRLL